MAGQAGLHVGLEHMRCVRLEPVSVTGFMLILHLVGGLVFYDDTLSREDCHHAAEALKEGGRMVADGGGVYAVETAHCVVGDRTQIDGTTRNVKELLDG